MQATLWRCLHSLCIGTIIFLCLIHTVNTQQPVIPVAKTSIIHIY